MTFNVTASDPSISEFRWDFDDDGVFDYPGGDAWTTETSATHTYVDDYSGNVVVQGRGECGSGGPTDGSNFGGPTSPYWYVYPANSGWKFTPRCDLTITQLGGYQWFNQGGYAYSIRIWDSVSQTMLGSCTPVDLTFQWTWCTLDTPINVLAGHDYIIAEHRSVDYYPYFMALLGPPGGPPPYSPPPPTKITVGNFFYKWTTPNAYPSSDGGNQVIMMIDFRSSVDSGVQIVTATAPVGISNVPPTVMITEPVPGSVYAVGEPVSFAGSFMDPGIADTHTATWLVDDVAFPGTMTETGGVGTVGGAFAFTTAGVYKVTLTVVDDDGGVGTASTVGDLTAFVVVYDPNGGFVTGGGWINSPPGAYPRDPTLTGRATFGFVSKYENGAKIPTGETEFQFQVANLNFHSTSYDWLVCGGPKCKYKGDGTINGAGGYSFLLTAIDGQLPGGGGQDKLRMKIWITMTGQIVYDSQMGADDNADPTTVIGGGSIVIHKG